MSKRPLTAFHFFAYGLSYYGTCFQKFRINECTVTEIQITQEDLSPFFWNINETETIGHIVGTALGVPFPTMELGTSSCVFSAPKYHYFAEEKFGYIIVHFYTLTH
jgi:hypothetical protein